MADQYKDFFAILEHTKRERVSVDPVKRLFAINKLIDDGLGKALKVAYKASFIAKCAYSFLGSENAIREQPNACYGHLRLDDKFFRLSTCLDTRNLIAQIPASEKAYWNEQTYICWANNDFFVCVKTEDLEKASARPTPLGNIEYNLYELILGGKLSSFGSYTMDTLVQPGKTASLANVQLPEKFYSIFAKGCTASHKPKYAVVRVSGSRYVEYYSTVDAMKKQLGIKLSQQYMSSMARKNAELLERNFTVNKNKLDNYMLSTKKVQLKGEDFAIVSLPYLAGNKEMLSDIIDDCERRSDNVRKAEYEERAKPISKDEAVKYVETKTGKSVKNILKVKSLFLDYSKLNCDQALELNQLILYDKT